MPMTKVAPRADQERIRRTTRVRLTFGGGLALLAVLVIWQYVAYWPEANADPVELALATGFALFLLVVCLLGVAFLLESVVADDQGVFIVGPLRRRHWPWERIQDIDAGANTAFTVTPFLTLETGRKVWLNPANGFAAGHVPRHVEDAVQAMRHRKRQSAGG